MLVWVLVGLGLVIMIAYAAFGHRVALALVVLWVLVAILGGTTGIGVRR